MSSKLSIRYSGKLIKLPITPSTPMHEVLRAACQQHGLGDSARFELQHGPARRAVDLSLPFRLTGISNNATVNLAPSSGTSREAASSAASVRVALQVAGEASEQLGAYRLTALLGGHPAAWAVVRASDQWLRQTVGRDACELQELETCISEADLALYARN